MSSPSRSVALARSAPSRVSPRAAERLRAHRLPVAELIESSAMAYHPVVGAFEARVVDLSSCGVALRVEDDVVKSVRVGDAIRTLRVETGARQVGTSDGVVRHVTRAEAEAIVGVELADTLDLGVVYDEARRCTFAKDGGPALVRTTPPTEYEAWVEHLAAYLASLAEVLDREDATLARLDASGREHGRRQLVAEIAPVVVATLNAAREELSMHVGHLSEDDRLARRAVYREKILPTFARSPFMRRAFEKPLGYAGDFEMMNMLYRDHAEGDSILGRVLNVYVAQEPAATANINRLELLGVKIRESVQRRGRDRARILSIGCGPAHEVIRLLEQSPQLAPHLDVVLIDQEPKVIEHGERWIVPLAARLGARVRLIRESVRNLVGKRSLADAIGERDFVYSAGLFDYLSPRTFVALLDGLYGCVAPGGELAVGNVALHNPTRWWMEYALDWYLHHRSPADLLELASGLVPAPSRVCVEAEPTGVNLFLSVRR